MGAAAVCAVLAVTGCSSSDTGSDGATGNDLAGSVTISTVDQVDQVAQEPVEPEVFDGTLEDFYRVPDPLPVGQPGDLIRVQEVQRGPSEVTVRIMYHSTDAEGRDRAVTGVVTRPTADAPDDGWPIVVTAPGTVGLASMCAPSRRGTPPPAFGVTGVQVMTDYIGMGPIGERQAYLSRESEGHSVLDAARAARALDGSGAGDRLLIFGHSQGGHGAQSAHELAANYAPDLELLGTVSGAPAAMFDRTYGGIDDIVARIVTTMGVYGVATDHPEIRPEDYLTPAALEVAGVLDEACLGDIIEAFTPLAASPDYWKVDPTTTEPGRSMLLANDVGNQPAAAPLLLISGTEDVRVVHQRVLDLFDRLCTTGQVTELLVLEGANHDNEIPIARGRIEQWMADRLDGNPPTDSCAAPR